MGGVDSFHSCNQRRTSPPPKTLEPSQISADFDASVWRHQQRQNIKIREKEKRMRTPRRGRRHHSSDCSHRQDRRGRRLYRRRERGRHSRSYDQEHEFFSQSSLVFQKVKEKVIELPIKHPDLFESLGIAQPKDRSWFRSTLEKVPEWSGNFSLWPENMPYQLFSWMR